MATKKTEAQKHKETMDELKKMKFITTVQGGKEFILYSGLLHLAHNKGFSGSNTTMIQAPSNENGFSCIIMAQVTVNGNTFSDVGDASPQNVGKKIIPHIIRMASTRALARALRQAVNIGMTCFEELGADAFSTPKSNKSGAKSMANNEPAPLNSGSAESPPWENKSSVPAVPKASASSEEKTNIVRKLGAAQGAMDTVINEGGEDGKKMASEILFSIAQLKELPDNMAGAEDVGDEDLAKITISLRWLGTMLNGLNRLQLCSDAIAERSGEEGVNLVINKSRSVLGMESFPSTLDEMKKVGLKKINELADIFESLMV